MAPHSFTLKPFPGKAPKFNITGTLSRDRNCLILCYQLQGPIPSLSVPPPAATPERRNELWTGTCFELFLAQAGQAAYNEVNLSPAGHWNVYCFDDYRKGMRAAPGYPAPVISIEHDDRQLTLSAVLDLSTLGLAEVPLQVAVTAVLLDIQQQAQYWSLNHPRPTPDFHHRDGFLLRLPRYNGVEYGFYRPISGVCP